MLGAPGIDASQRQVQPAWRHTVQPLIWVAALLLLLSGCGWMSGWFGDDEPAAAAATADVPPEGAPQPEGPFSGGVLNVIAQRAPAGGATQLLARLASEFGWEPQIAQNPIVKEDVLEEDFEERVEPALLGLYYKNGFSVLSVVGEGHQFNRDSVVRGAIGSSRLFVTTRDPVRIIFLKPVQNVQIVYHQDGTEPQVYTVSDQAVVAVRQSLHKYFLR